MQDNNMVPYARYAMHIRWNVPLIERLFVYIRAINQRDEPAECARRFDGGALNFPARFRLRFSQTSQPSEADVADGETRAVIQERVKSHWKLSLET